MAQFNPDRPVPRIPAGQDGTHAVHGLPGPGVSAYVAPTTTSTTATFDFLRTPGPTSGQPTLYALPSGGVAMPRLPLFYDASTYTSPLAPRARLAQIRQLISHLGTVVATTSEKDIEVSEGRMRQIYPALASLSCLAGQALVDTLLRSLEDMFHHRADPTRRAHALAQLGTFGPALDQLEQLHPSLALGHIASLPALQAALGRLLPRMQQLAMIAALAQRQQLHEEMTAMVTALATLDPRRRQFKPLREALARLDTDIGRAAPSLAGAMQQLTHAVGLVLAMPGPVIGDTAPPGPSANAGAPDMAIARMLRTTLGEVQRALLESDVGDASRTLDAALSHLHRTGSAQRYPQLHTLLGDLAQDLSFGHPTADGIEALRQAVDAMYLEDAVATLSAASGLAAQPGDGSVRTTDNPEGWPEGSIFLRMQRYRDDHAELDAAKLKDSLHKDMGLPMAAADVMSKILTHELAQRVTVAGFCHYARRPGPLPDCRGLQFPALKVLQEYMAGAARTPDGEIPAPTLEALARVDPQRKLPKNTQTWIDFIWNLWQPRSRYSTITQDVNDAAQRAGVGKFVTVQDLAEETGHTVTQVWNSIASNGARYEVHENSSPASLEVALRAEPLDSTEFLAALVARAKSMEGEFTAKDLGDLNVNAFSGYVAAKLHYLAARTPPAVFYRGGGYFTTTKPTASDTAASVLGAPQAKRPRTQ